MLFLCAVLDLPLEAFGIRLSISMKNIIVILALTFFISDYCSADARVLAELMSKSNAKSKANALKNKKVTKKVKTENNISRRIKPKKIVEKNKSKFLQDIKPKEIVTSEELEIRNDLAYIPNEDKPFTGKHQEYHPNKNKYIEINYKDGKKSGLIVMWDENEHKIGQLSFFNGNQQEY
jgi:antitoxin component YwqK of YwqJK toxin-antitoxin module